MKRLFEGAKADVDLQVELEKTSDILQDLDSWVNHSPNYDFHSIDLFKNGQSYFLMVDFGLTKTIWRITASELRQIRNKDSLDEIVEFIERMTDEPIKER